MGKSWLTGKKVIITGSSSGIGREIVELLLKKYSCTVIGVSRNREKAERVEKEIANFSSQYSKYCFDVSELDGWIEFSSYLSKINFVPDLVINNAGMLPTFKSVLKTDIVDIENVLKTDFLSAVYSFKSIYGKNGYPAFVNVSSSASLASLAGTSSYSAAKSALRAFTECLSAELKKKTYIAVVCPGFTKTDIFKNQKQAIDQGIVGKISMPVKKMAKKIVRGISRRKKKMVFGKDAHLMSVFARCMPTKSTYVMSSVLKMSKMSIFEEVFDE